MPDDSAVYRNTEYDTGAKLLLNISLHCCVGMMYIYKTYIHYTARVLCVAQS